MGNSIFISYRRDDSSPYAGRLHDNLSARFTQEQVFFDIEQIEPGEDFVTVIEKAVGSCSVLLAVIGRDWLGSSEGQPDRLHSSNDFVRLEIAAALARGIRVIPILVQGARMPSQEELPADLAALARRQAHKLGEGHYWRADVERLITILKRQLDQPIAQVELRRLEKKSLPRTEHQHSLTKASPLVRKIASEYGLDIAQIEGTGMSGRITKNDILCFIESRSTPTTTSTAPRTQTAQPPAERYSVPTFSSTKLNLISHGLVGSWALLIETPFEKSIPGRLILIEDSNILLGKIESEMGGGELSDVVLRDKGFQAAMLFEMEGAAMSATIDGTAEGDKLEGKITLQGLPPLSFAGTREPLAPK